MRKAVVLLIGILLLGGMMGMVSAATGNFNGGVLYIEVTDPSNYGYKVHNELFYANAPSLGYLVNLSYDAAVGTYSGSGCVIIQEVVITTNDNAKYAYGFQYCGLPGEVKIMSNDTEFKSQTLSVDATNYNPPNKFGIEVSSNSIKFYVNGILRYTYPPSFRIKQFSKVQAGTRTSGVAYKLYIDNVVEKIQGDINVDITENFDDDSDGYFDETVGALSTSVIPADQVPLFSDDVTIVSLALLLALAAVWFFKRK